MSTEGAITCFFFLGSSFIIAAAGAFSFYMCGNANGTDVHADALLTEDTRERLFNVLIPTRVFFPSSLAFKPASWISDDSLEDMAFVRFCIMTALLVLCSNSGCPVLITHSWSHKKLVLPAPFAIFKLLGCHLHWTQSLLDVLHSAVLLDPDDGP